MSLSEWIDRLRDYDIRLFDLGGVPFTASSVLKVLVFLLVLVWFAGAVRRWTVGGPEFATHEPHIVVGMNAPERQHNGLSLRRCT